MDTKKRVWQKPQLTKHGSVEEITLQTIKPKQLGVIDDFGVPAIEDPS